eukprot:COSAG05_NODE_391_length_10419_cov_8.156686_7_plen_527_part_00
MEEEAIETSGGVSLGGLARGGNESTGGGDRYAASDGEEDAYGDESFGGGDSEPEPDVAQQPASAPQTAAQYGATDQAATMSERVQEFLKRTSILGKDDPRILAQPIFDELLRSKRLSEWNEAECVVWITSIGLERYRANFFHNHVTGKTLDRITSEKLKLDIGIGALGHRELLIDMIDEVKARNSEFLKRINKKKREKRQLEKAEERELEKMHMELLRREVEYKDADDALIKAKKLEREKMAYVEEQRKKIQDFQKRLKDLKKEEALQNYGRISDLKQCTFKPELTETSLQYASGSERGAMWNRIKSDQLAKERKLKDLKMVEEDTLGIMTKHKQVFKAQQFIGEYCKPGTTFKSSDFTFELLDEALTKAARDGHCTTEEKDQIDKRSNKEDKLLATYNVLRINQFLNKYESEMKTRERKNAKPKKKRLSEDERKERDAAIQDLVARMHPEPKSAMRKPTPQELERARLQRIEERKKSREQINRFLRNYEEDMHQRRVNVKKAQHKAADEDRAAMIKPDFLAKRSS